MSNQNRPSRLATESPATGLSVGVISLRRPIAVIGYTVVVVIGQLLKGARSLRGHLGEPIDVLEPRQPDFARQPSDRTVPDCSPNVVFRGKNCLGSVTVGRCEEL